METQAELSPRSASKRRDILETAAELFSQRGFGKTSLKLLAAEAHVSTSTIYTYFADKTELLDQAIEWRLELVQEHLRHVLDEQRDPVEAMVVALRSINRSVARDPLLRKLLAYESHVVDRLLSRRVGQVLERIDTIGVATIREAVEAGALACEDPEALLAVARLSIQGWLVNSIRGGETVSEERLTDMLVTQLRALSVKDAR